MAKTKPEPFKQKQGEQVRSSNSNLRFDPFPSFPFRAGTL
jgi:hypothetical protein